MIAAAVAIATAVPLGQKPAQLITKMEKVYSACKSYSDHGTVISVISENGLPDKTDIVTFETEFAHHGKIHVSFFTSLQGPLTNFEIIAPGRKRLFSFRGVDGPGWQTTDWVAYLGRNGIFESEISMGEALSSYAGLSDGCAYTVPAMLFPGGIGLYFHQMSDSKLLGQEQIDGHACYKLSSAKYQTQFWIDSKSFLLRKTVENMDLTSDPKRPIRSVDSTYYQPVLDSPVEDKNFKAPAFHRARVRHYVRK